MLHAQRQLLSQSRQRPLCCTHHELPSEPRPPRQSCCRSHGSSRYTRHSSCCRSHGSGRCVRHGSCAVAVAAAAIARAAAAAATATAAAAAWAARATAAAVTVTLAAVACAASTRCIQPGSRASCRILHAPWQLLSLSLLQRGSGRCSRCTWPSHAPRQLLSQSRQRPLCCMRHKLPPKPRPPRQSCCRGHGSGHCMRRSSCIVAAATAATARAGAAAVTATAAAVACATAAALSAAAAIAHAPRQLLPQPRQQPLHAVPSGRWTPGTGE